jgi:hypothetical protein
MSAINALASSPSETAPINFPPNAEIAAKFLRMKVMRIVTTDIGLSEGWQGSELMR